MVTIDQLKSAIEASWAADTSFCSEEWTPHNRARGQCVVTSLVVQHYLGGELQKVDTVFHGKPESHYYNVLPDGSEIDLTRGQYPPDQTLTPSMVNLHGFKDPRDKMLHEPKTRANYELLLARVRKCLSA
jgi:hypothetical protein